MSYVKILTILSMFCFSSCSAAKSRINEQGTAMSFKQVFKNEQSCSKDNDCQLINATCCNCNAGGKQIGIARSFYSQKQKARKKECYQVMCPQVISNDASCKSTAAGCENGICVAILPK